MTDRQLPCRAVSGVAEHDKATGAAESGGGGHGGAAGHCATLEETIAYVAGRGADDEEGDLAHDGGGLAPPVRHVRGCSIESHVTHHALLEVCW